MLKYISGYIKFEVFCPNSNPFALIRILNEKVEISDVEKVTGNNVIFTCKIKHRSLVLQCIEECGGEIKSENQKGLYLQALKYISRPGLLAGGIICILILYLSQLFIWEIRVVGNENIVDEEILYTLEYLGFSEGSIKSKANLDKIRNDFLLCENRISWIAINIKGNIAYAEISEREFPPEKTDKNSRVNIVASCDGVILRVDAYEGGKQVNEGETVSKGQLLISAFFDTKDGNVFFTNARGSVLADTIHNFEVKLGKKTTIKNYTGRIKEEKSLKLLGYEIPLHFDTAIGFSNYDKHISEENIEIFGTRLPVKLISKVYREYEIIEKELSEKDAKQKALSLLMNKISKEMIKGDIISMNTSYENNKNQVIIRCNARCTEDIAMPQQVYFTNNH